MAVTKKLILGIVLALFAFIVLAMWQSGTLEEIKEVVYNIDKPDLSVGLEEIKGEELLLPSNVHVEAKALRSTLMAMAESENTNCFETFGGFKKDLGEEADQTVTFSFTYGQDKKGEEFVDGTWVEINPYKSQIVDRYFVEGMRPCVIAGSEQLVETFINKFAKKKSVSGKFHSPVDSINIYYNEEGYNGNAIRVSGDGFGLGRAPVNGKGKNFESDGVLFKVDDEYGSICFFPTNDYVDNEDGMNDDWLEDSGDEESFAYKIGHGQVTKCTERTGYGVIEISANDDASSGELDCDVKDHGNSEGEINFFANNLKDYETEDGDCKALIDKNMANSDGTFPLPESGCWLLISEQDPGLNDCGWVEIGPGEVVPDFSSNRFTMFYPFGAPNFENTDPLCLLNYYQWQMPASNDGALICDGKDHRWYICDKSGIGNPEKEIEPFTRKMKVDNEDVIYTCKLKGQNEAGNDIYDWEAENTEHLSWMEFEGIELFANNDEDYPNSCKTFEGNIYSACDYRAGGESKGGMGITKSADLGEGTFICPSEDNDCDNYYRTHNGYYNEGPNNCAVYMSEDDDGARGSNDCGSAAIPAGESIWQGTTSLFHCTGNAGECPEGPIKTWIQNDGENSRCLLKNKWRNTIIPGDFICADDHNWKLCEARKEGSCLNVAGKDWCCEKSESGKYLFYEE